MAYCSIDQLTVRYGAAMLQALSDRAELAPVTPAIDLDLFNRAISDADARIDGYLLGRYALPLVTPPALLVDLSQRIAIYNAHGQVAVEKIRLDYEDALKTLKEIASGVIRLSIAGVEAPSSGLSGEVRTNDPERPLTADTMRGYI